MIFPKAKKIARALQWHHTNDGVFGLYKGLFFNIWDASILSSPQYKYISTATGKITDEQRRNLSDALKDNKSQLKFTNFEIRETDVYFVFVENLSYTKLNTIYSLLDYLVTLFMQTGIVVHEGCHVCGSSQNVNHYNQNEMGLLLCENCFRQREDTYTNTEAARLSRETNYITGFVGSFLFSIPGIIGWIVVAVFAGRLAAALVFVLALLEIKGYDVFRGPRGPWKRFLLVLSNFISVLIANLATVMVYLMRGGLGWSQSISELQTNQAVQDVLIMNLLISSVLAVVTWIWLMFIRKDDKPYIALAPQYE